MTDFITNFKIQLNLFYIALEFLTRIPVPNSVDHSQDKLNHASRYFPLIGWFIGIICALTFWVVGLLLPNEIAVLFSMLIGIFLTGCLHEDGLADTCDGLGGGWTQSQKLTIMKDSRIGTYGATGLWFVLVFKFCLLVNLAQQSSSLIIIAIIVAHPLSRLVSNSMMFLLPYVANIETSKVKSLAESQQKIDWQISLVIGLFSLIFVSASALWLVITLILFLGAMRLLLKKQIQGFTGDTLGATQQVSELIIYTVVLAVSLSSGLTL